MAAGLSLFFLSPAHASFAAEHRTDSSGGAMFRLVHGPAGHAQKTENNAVVSQNTAPRSAPQLGNGDKIKRMQDRMLEDPETVQKIRNLENDPQMQQILQDPELMRAIQQGDLNRLVQDPKFMELMNNETVEEIIQKNQSR